VIYDEIYDVIYHVIYDEIYDVIYHVIYDVIYRNLTSVQKPTEDRLI